MKVNQGTWELYFKCIKNIRDKLKHVAPPIKPDTHAYEIQFESIKQRLHDGIKAFYWRVHIELERQNNIAALKAKQATRLL